MLINIYSPVYVDQSSKFNHTSQSFGFEAIILIGQKHSFVWSRNVTERYMALSLTLVVFFFRWSVPFDYTKCFSNQAKLKSQHVCVLWVAANGNRNFSLFWLQTWPWNGPYTNDKRAVIVLCRKQLGVSIPSSFFFFFSFPDLH